MLMTIFRWIFIILFICSSLYFMMVPTSIVWIYVFSNLHLSYIGFCCLVNFFRIVYIVHKIVYLCEEIVMFFEVWHML